MICPHCFQTIDDDATACPHCHEQLNGGEDRARTDFVFCDGCGARLFPRDRTCPKCGRPAPGILSPKTAASDLAAGKTASFPRLTQKALETELPRTVTSAAQVLSDSMDPSATNVLEIPLEEAGSSSRRKHEDEDPYHKPHRPWKRIAAAFLAVALVGGGAYMVAADPLGIMPGFYEAFGNAAQDAFPSRWDPEDNVQATGNEAEPDDAEGEGGSDEILDRALSEEQAFATLTSAWETIGAYQDTLGDVIVDYNAWFIADDKAKREEGSKSAYAMRDAVQATIDSLDEIELSEGSAYTEDLEHMKQLATWMYNRVDVLCQSWDISLAVPEGEHAYERKAEISQPLIDALDAEGNNQNLVQFERHYAAWRPSEPAN